LADTIPHSAAKPRWLVLNKLDLIAEDERAKAVALVRQVRIVGKGLCFPSSPSMAPAAESVTYAIQAWLEQHPVAVSTSEAL
jgi:GTP-binding protein